MESLNKFKLCCKGYEFDKAQDFSMILGVAQEKSSKARHYSLPQ